MRTLIQTEKQAKPVKPVSLSRPKKKRLGGDLVGSFQARCASALRLALPLELKAHGAANRCGFSRPFVAALLDSGTYTGKVHRTAGGHRKVLASEFEALVAKASACAPKTLTQARKAVDLRRLDEAPATPRKERKQSKVLATELAHKLGLSA